MIRNSLAESFKEGPPRFCFSPTYRRRLIHLFFWVGRNSAKNKKTIKRTSFESLGKCITNHVLKSHAQIGKIERRILLLRFIWLLADPACTSMVGERFNHVLMLCSLYNRFYLFSPCMSSRPITKNSCTCLKTTPAAPPAPSVEGWHLWQKLYQKPVVCTGVGGCDGDILCPGKVCRRGYTRRF